MWRRKDSKRYVPSDLRRRLRALSFHDPAGDHATRHALHLRLDAHGVSVIGRTRRVNQDRFFILPIEGSPVNCLLGVADGLGGHPGGTEAANFVADTLQAFVREELPFLLRTDRSDPEIIETLTRGLRRCHTVLQSEVERRPEYSGMGTTLTSALVIWPLFYLVHLGDSRGYHLHRGALRRLTRDQTYGQALVDAGVLTSEKMATSRWKYVVSNFITGKIPEEDPEVHPDVYVDQLQPGDSLLFCTDGLTDVVSDEDLQRVMTGLGSAERQSLALLDLASARSARDDATVLVARFDENGPDPGGRRRSR
jgi:PPM family protein phosphatase